MRWARLRHPRAGAGVVLVVGGLLAMLAGSGALLAQQHAAQSWSETDEAARAARQVAAPTPRWIDGSAPTATLRVVSTPTRPPITATPAVVVRVAAPPVTTPHPAPGPDATQSADIAPKPTPDAPPSIAQSEAVSPAPVPAEEAPSDDPPTGAPTGDPVVVAGAARVPATAVEILASEFRFLDPPEPGAQATIGLQLRNRSVLPTGPLRLSLSTRWLSGWRIVEAEPPVLADRVRQGAWRTFDFPGLDGGAEGAVELLLVATDDAVDPPDLHLALAYDNVPSASDQPEADAAEIGQVRPETVAPRPRPGPARAVQIPRLGLRAAVVQAAWEPPAFVIGQLRQTANLSEGNTVLIGHLNGLAGNIFAHLDQLEPGDEVIATSRGLEYRFVVSETMILPGDEGVPIQPTDEPRLTLMTCAGDWDPIHQDYSHRLWVVAEPPELAETTLSGETPGPLSRQLGLAPTLTLLAPADLGPPPKPAEPDQPEAPSALTQPGLEALVPPAPAVEILQPADGARVGSQVVVRGRRAEDANLDEPLWLVIRAEIEGSRWYPYAAPLIVRRDGTWEASVEIGGRPGIGHTIVVAAVDAATDARLKRHVTQQPGRPLPILPDAFEHGARIVVERH